MPNNAVVGSILANLRQIELVFSETIDVFKVDRGNTGDYRELTVKQFLRSYLTHDFRITKGSIFSTTANSQNIDCVVLAPNHPNLSAPGREILLAEGIYSAVEVKPDIYNKVEFDRALVQCKSVKSLERTWSIPESPFQMPAPNYLKRIPFVLFSIKSLSPTDMVSFIDSELKSGQFTIETLPDIIMTLDNGMYLLTNNIKESPAGHILLEQNPENALCSLFHFSANSTEDILAVFIFHFLCFPRAYEISEEPILLKYLQGLTEYSVTSWAFTF